MESSNIPVETQLWMYSAMFQSRQYETALKGLYLEGKTPLFNMAKGPLPGELHLSSGQEPCAVGVCAHLEPGDFLSATHRSHHFAIAKGVDLRRMSAEILGKKAGLSGGRGGHMHLLDRSVSFFSSGIVGEGIPFAAGAAHSFQLRGEPNVAVAEIGEAAANQGAFHEALNLAAIWRLPLVCIISDNNYGVSVSKAASTAVRRNSDRASSYGIPGVYVDDNDPYKIFEVAGEALARARSGGGPSLIEIETCRLEGHFMGDQEAYRPSLEREQIKKSDPIPLMRSRLIATECATEQELIVLERAAQGSVDDALRFAREAPYPSPEEALEHVFVR